MRNARVVPRLVYKITISVDNDGLTEIDRDMTDNPNNTIEQMCQMLGAFELAVSNEKSEFLKFLKSKNQDIEYWNGFIDFAKSSRPII